MRKKGIRDIDIKGKRLLMRVDFNVPLDENGNITDDNRIRETLPTIEYALDKGAKLILMSHLGRPKGRGNGCLQTHPCWKTVGRAPEKAC